MVTVMVRQHWQAFEEGLRAKTAPAACSESELLHFGGHYDRLRGYVDSGRVTTGTNLKLAVHHHDPAASGNMATRSHLHWQYSPEETPLRVHGGRAPFLQGPQLTSYCLPVSAPNFMFDTGSPIMAPPWILPSIPFPSAGPASGYRAVPGHAQLHPGHDPYASGELEVGYAGQPVSTPRTRAVVTASELFEYIQVSTVCHCHGRNVTVKPQLELETDSGCCTSRNPPCVWLGVAFSPTAQVTVNLKSRFNLEVQVVFTNPVVLNIMPSSSSVIRGLRDDRNPSSTRLVCSAACRHHSMVECCIDFRIKPATVSSCSLLQVIIGSPAQVLPVPVPVPLPSEGHTVTAPLPS
jgi:hypothetical protein